MVAEGTSTVALCGICLRLWQELENTAYKETMEGNGISLIYILFEYLKKTDFYILVSVLLIGYLFLVFDGILNNISVWNSKEASIYIS